MAIEVPLGRGLVALVSAEDVERVLAVRWQANVKGPHCYAQARLLVDGRRQTVSMHRFVLCAPRGLWVDHIDGNGLNNQRSNLRLVSPGQNRANSIKRREAACAFKGVTKKDMKWGAQISSNKLPSTPWYIGIFDTAADAARAYDAVARILFGPYARVNFPRNGEQCATDIPPSVVRAPAPIRAPKRIRIPRSAHRARLALPEEIAEPGPVGAIAVKITGGITWVDPGDVEIVCSYAWRTYCTKPGWTPHVQRSVGVLTQGGHSVKLLHRLLMDADPGQIVDHIDRNGLNNTRANLRFVTEAQNRINTVRRNQFGFRGVIKGPRDSGYRAKIVVDGKPINLGTFSTPEEAARAYDDAAIRYHKEFALLNAISHGAAA